MAAKTTAEHDAKVPEGGPRERLLAVAKKLFYDEGVHVVGIDRIIEEAGVAKASLYQHFGSRDGLVRAYLEEHFAARRAHIDAVLAKYPTPREQLLGLFQDTASALSGDVFRGCRFVNASIEARPDESALAITEEYRSWLRSVFVGLAEQAGAGNPILLGRQLALLYDGVAVASRFDQDRSGARDAVVAAATTLVDTAIPRRRRRPAPRTAR